jgi:hypothetical protein
MTKFMVATDPRTEHEPLGPHRMPAPRKILELVDVFERIAGAYRSSHYNEAQVRQEFINPLCKCLGWEMDNEQGHAEAYKDVIESWRELVA